MIDQWSPDWSDATFSLEERDRRWKKVRELMARDGIDAIACPYNTNSHDRGAQDTRYITQLGENCQETTALITFDDVTAWQIAPGVWPSSNWFPEGARRAPRGSGGRTISARLKELGFDRGTLGIAGLDGTLLGHSRQGEGEVNWASIEIIKENFPNAKIVSASALLGEARFAKSEEEIDFLRKATEVAQKTLDSIFDYGRAGMSERDVWGRMLHANAAAGGSFPPMLGWASGPLGNTYRRLEQPTFRTLQLGDVLTLEIEGKWGGYAGQLDQAFSIGPAHQDLKDGMKLAFEAYNRTVDAMKPGVTIGELIEAAKVTGMNGRGSAGLTMHGRGTGDDGPMVVPNPPEALMSLELVENCSVAVKPSAMVDGKGDYGRWGDTVVVRKNSVERLGTRPQELYELI